MKWLCLPSSLAMLAYTLVRWFLLRKSGARWYYSPCCCWDCFWAGPLGHARVESGIFYCPRCKEGEV